MVVSVSTRKLVVGAAAAVAAVAAAVWLLVPSEESRVKAAFARAEEILGKSGGESLVTVAAKAGALAELAADEIEVSIPEERLSAIVRHKEVARHAAMLLSSCDTLSVRFGDVRVLSIDGDVAQATADMQVTGTGVSSSISGREARRVSTRLKKDSGGEWRFALVLVESPGGR